MKIILQLVVSAIFVMGTVSASYAEDRNHFRSSPRQSHHDHGRGHHDKGISIYFGSGAPISGYNGYPYFVDPRFGYRYNGYPYFRDFRNHDPRFCRDPRHNHYSYRDQHRGHRHQQRHDRHRDHDGHRGNRRDYRD